MTNKKLIFCTNVHSSRDIEHLIKNISHINSKYDKPPIFVVNNGLQDLVNLPKNVHYRKFNYYPDTQIGPINSTLNSLKFASETIENIEEYNVIFSHADLYATDFKLIEKYLNELDYYDVICRNYIGPGGNKIPGIGYYMTEDILISGKSLNKFKYIQYDKFQNSCELINGVLEITLAALFDDVLKFKVKRIDIERQTECVINELGFYHDHIHYKEDFNSIPGLCLLTHTHSDCFDLLLPFFESLKKYYYDYRNLNTTHYILSDKKIDSKYNTINYIYDEKTNFSQRILQAIDNISEEYIILMLEDYILYDFVDHGKIRSFVQTMEKDRRIDFIRLIQSGSVFTENYNSDLFILDKHSEYYFSTQVTIWRKSFLKTFFEKFKMVRVQDEIEGSFHLKNISNLGLCVTGRGKKVGNHFDSLVWPYIAAAIVNKKWTINEYPILKDILAKYDIDPNIRGFYI